MYRDDWTKAEKTVARRAFELAYSRECETIAAEVRRRATTINGAEEIWALHDYLIEQRKATDAKYDYRYSQLEFVFSRLVAEGWLRLDELAGLDEEKTERIRGIVKWATAAEEV